MPIRLRTLLFLSICLLSMQNLVAQRIIPDEKILDFSVEDQPLRDVLFDLSEKANVTIAFQDQIIPSDTLVSISIRKERLGKIVDYLIEDYQLKYKIVGNQIVIIQDPYYEKQKKEEAQSDLSTISGTIRDAETGETLVNAHVFLYDGSLGVVSNEYGFYSFTLPKGLNRIYARYIGYEMGIHEISLTRDTIVDIELDNMTRLREVQIVEKSLSPIKPVDIPEMASVEVMSIDQIKSKLPLAGEPDVMRLAYAQGGVTSGSDGFGGMSVRGGETNQNLILFDGIPVYNAQHAFGLFSIFNSNVIKSAKLYKGAFPSHYSGRLSSVMDIRTREGSFRKLKGDFSLGLLTMTGSLEGPIVKEKSSFLVSVRRTFVDPWIRALTEYTYEREGRMGSSSISFLDINGKLNFNVGRFSKLYLSYYSGGDNFDTEITSEEDFDEVASKGLDQLFWTSRNALASLRWNIRMSQKMFLNASLYRSTYSFESFDHDRTEDFDLENPSAFLDARFDAGFYRTKINDLGARLAFDYIPNANHFIKFGFGYIKHDFSPAFVVVNQTDSLRSLRLPIEQEDIEKSLVDTELGSSEIEFYVEDEIQLGQSTRLNLGLNHTIINTGNTSYHLPQPRIMLALGKKTKLFKASFGRMSQFLHTLTNTGLGVPIDVWLPSTDNIRPESSWVVSMGPHFLNEKFGSYGAEVFYKKYDNLTRFSETGFVTISENSNWESLIPIGVGESYGMEFYLNETVGKLKYDLAYTLSWSNRQFDEINDGRKFAFRYDRRHVLNFGIRYKLDDNMDISAHWEYGSGTPITLPDNQAYIEQDENGNEIGILVYSSINNGKLPDYHRLDFGLNINNTHKWGTSTLTFGLYNAYNRRNPFYRDIIFNPNADNRLTYRDITILPVLPTFRYAVSF